MATPAATRDALGLAARFRDVRARTESLAAPLSAEDCCVQSMPDASPVKWHLAHTTWFFETFVLEPRSGYRAFDPGFRVLFNSYYQTVGPQHPRPQRGLLTRPSLDRVREYRAHVDRQIEALLEGEVPAAVAGVLEIGLNHEQQHQELLLTDVKHLLAQSPLSPAYRPDLPPAAPGTAAGPMAWMGFDGGIVEIGQVGPGFAFDNERPRHRVLLEPYALASRPVVNREVLAFLEDRGYQRPELWLSEGWDRIRQEGWTAPFYWRQDQGGWSEHTLGGTRPLDLEAPACHLSYYEADAIARWLEARLPTEAEWEAAAASRPIAGNLLESGRLQPVAAIASPPVPGGEGPAQLGQLYGDVWEWTASAYSPYPGYRPPAGALGEYNGKFMCGQLVLRGGSCLTPASHLRPTYRNFFPPWARWQMTGLRLARDAS